MKHTLLTIEHIAELVERGMLAIIPPLVVAVIVLFLFAMLA